MAGETLFGDTLRGIFSRRLNRFLVQCHIGDRLVTAHLPNPGRLWEILIPRRELILTVGTGRTPYQVAAAVCGDDVILLHTQKSNDVTASLIKAGKVPGFEGAEIACREFRWGEHRFDFLLARNGEEVIVEVKSCTLMGRELAMFPDAVTSRGRRHLEALAALVEEGRRCSVIFLIHALRPRYFLPDYHTDYAFARAFQACRGRLSFIALRIAWTEDLRLRDGVEEALIPWDILHRECRDGGCYILIISLKHERRIRAGSAGVLLLPPGYYLYVGAARWGLTQRVANHLRTGSKGPRGCIDHLCREADSRRALFIRTADDLEGKLVSSIGTIAEDVSARFPSSPCSEPIHLFYMAGDPLQREDFLRIISYYRMDRFFSGGRL